MIPFRLKHLVYTLRRLLKYCAVNSWTSGSSLCVVCCRVSFRRGAHSIAKPLPASAIFLSFFFLSQHFPSVERVCAFCSALWDANFTASSSDLHRPSLWARWRQQQRRFRGSMDFCSVPISWYPYNRALYIVARLGSINVLCICIYIAHECVCVYSFPLLSLSIRGAGIDAVKCAIREEKERPETRCVSTAAERASLINCCWSLES